MRMKLLSLLSLLLIGSGVFGQNTRLIAMAKSRSGWGYIDTTGKFVIPPNYVNTFGIGKSGYAMAVAYVQKLDLSGEELRIINIDRTIADVPLGNQFDTRSVLYQEFKDGLSLIKESDGFGYIDTLGLPMFDFVYDFATPFENGHATATSGGYCYIVHTNRTDSLVLESSCRKAFAFNEGIAPYEATNGMFGAMDTSGKMIIKPEFQKIGSFQGGIAWARNADKKVGYINTHGEWVIEPKFDVAEEMDPVSGMARVKKDNSIWFYIDMNGTPLAVYRLITQGDFHEGLCWGKISTGYGFFNKLGEWIIPGQFDGVRNFKNGLAAAKKGKRWGFINQKGEWVIEPQFKRVKDFVVVNR